MLLVYPRAEPGTFTCPCGARFSDPVSIRDGICRVCGEPTGLCQAGRTLIPPRHVAATRWETPCPDLGTVWWCVKVPGGRGPGWKAIHPLLCEAHSGQGIYEHWIDGIPLDHGEEVEEVDIKAGTATAALKRAAAVAAIAASAVLGIGGAAAMTASAGHAPHPAASSDTYYHG